MCKLKISCDPNLPTGMNERAAHQAISDNVGSEVIKSHEQSDTVYWWQKKSFNFWTMVTKIERVLVLKTPRGFITLISRLPSNCSLPLTSAVARKRPIRTKAAAAGCMVKH
jgi:hypothetical protein